jgi:hypothetical protein
MNPHDSAPLPESFELGRPVAKYRRQPCPFPLKLIGSVFFLWSLLGWLRFGGALAERNLIITQIGALRHAYLLLAGLIWGLLGLPVLGALFVRAPWSPFMLIVASVLYPLFYWLERIFLWQDPNAHSNWPFMLLLTFVWVGLVAWGLRSAHRRQFFQRKL